MILVEILFHSEEIARTRIGGLQRHSLFEGIESLLRHRLALACLHQGFTERRPCDRAFRCDLCGFLIAFSSLGEFAALEERIAKLQPAFGIGRFSFCRLAQFLNAGFFDFGERIACAARTIAQRAPDQHACHQQSGHQKQRKSPA